MLPATGNLYFQPLQPARFKPPIVILLGLLLLAPGNLLGHKSPVEKPRGGSRTLILDDFEDGNLSSPLGASWKAITDKDVHGNSTVELNITKGGAHKSKHALQIAGEGGGGFQFPFAGAASSHKAMDLHGYAGLTFYARGDGKIYELQVLTAAVKDHDYFTKEFLAAKDWSQVRIYFKDLKQNPFWGQDVPWTGTDVGGVLFRRNGGGRFQFEIDDVAYFK